VRGERKPIYEGRGGERRKEGEWDTSKGDGREERRKGGGEFRSNSM